MAKKDSNQTLRLVFQILGFTFSLGFLIMVILRGRQTIHEICPYAVVCFGLDTNSFLYPASVVMAEAIIIGLAILVFSMFWGRKFCGWLCPLGTLQEKIYGLRSKKYRVKHRTPYYVDRKLAWLKYAILGITALMVLFGVGYLYMRLCPFYSLSQLFFLAIPGLVVMIIIIVKSAFGSREWCRFLCPYAALMNIFQWLGKMVGIRRVKIKRNLERCTDCGVCVLFCPMNINIQESEYVHDPNCIHCGLCALHCPKPGTYSEERECPK